MPQAPSEYLTPKLLEIRYLRAAAPLAATLHQPVAPDQIRIITGRLLGELFVDGQLHHYRVLTDEGLVILTPSEWLTPESIAAIGVTDTKLSAELEAQRLAPLKSLARQLRALAELEGVA